MRFRYQFFRLRGDVWDGIQVPSVKGFRVIADS